MPVIPALSRLRKEDCNEFGVSLRYSVKKKKKKSKETKVVHKAGFKKQQQQKKVFKVKFHSLGHIRREGNSGL